MWRNTSRRETGSIGRMVMLNTTVKTVGTWKTRRTAQKYADRLELAGHWTEVIAVPGGYAVRFFRRHCY
jgi:hypothetical protein